MLDALRFLGSLRGGPAGAAARWARMVEEWGVQPAAEEGGEVLLLDCCGRRLGRVLGRGAAAAQASAALQQALVASEDRRFWRHSGVDLVGLGRAVLSLGGAGGGSTLTQQLLKVRVLSDSRTLSRKTVEAAAALALERRLPKEAILEAYLSSAYFGHGAFGAHAAAAAYLDADCGQLQLPEAALLVALLPAPERLSPFRAPRRAPPAPGTPQSYMQVSLCAARPRRGPLLWRRGAVLRALARDGHISAAEAQALSQAPLPSALRLPPELAPDEAAASSSCGAWLKLQLEPSMPPPRTCPAPLRAPHFSAEVLSWLRAQGLVSSGPGAQPRRLRVHTTLDLQLQARKPIHHCCL